MSTDYQCKIILLFCFSCFYTKIGSQLTEEPDQILVACTGNTVNLRWNYITNNMITLQWFSESTEMMSQFTTNTPTYSNNYNASVVEFVADAEISLKAVTTASTGQYSCTVTYLSGDEYSNATYLTVYDTFTSGLSCQYNGKQIECTKPDPSVSLNATDGKGSNFDIDINPTSPGNYTICMYGGATICRGSVSTCTIVEVNIQGALTISYSGSNKLDSTTYILKCQIPGFDKAATWSKNGSPLTVCENTGCHTLISQPYSFRHDNSAIYVVFSKLTTSEHDQQWTCEHGTLKTHFTVKVDSSEEGAIVITAITCVFVIIIGIIGGLLIVFTPFIPISRADATKWYFSNRYICKGTVVYGIQIVIVEAVCQLLSIAVTTLVIFGVYPGQLSDLVIAVLFFLILVYPCLGILVFRCFVAFGGKKEMLYKKFDNNYERCSLAKKYGVRFTTHDIGMISFKIKAEKNAHMAVFGKNSGAPVVDIILGYRDNFRSVVVEPNQLEPKDDHRGEVISSTKYNTFYLKCEQNHITLLNGKEEPILTWKSDKNTSLEIEDIVISNSLQGTNYDGSGSPVSGEWIIFVRQGDRLDERDDDSRSFKTFLLVIVVLFPIAWLVLPIIGLLRLCIQDNSTSNRANGLPSHGIHECEYSCLRGSFCNKISNLDNQFESPDSPPAYSVKYNKSDVANKKNKKSQSVKIEGGDIENTGNMANPSTGNYHDKRLDKNMSNKGNEKQGLTPIQGVNLHIGGESKLNQKPFGTAVPLPPIDSPKKV